MSDGLVYGSVCSGIEAASVAWHPFGWRAAFLSEIDPFARAVLAHRFPDVPLRGDFTEIQAGDHEPIDLLVGGTPCQSFSVAGLRGGLDDERGNLALEFLRLAGRLRPRWLVWENVPGVFSSVSHAAPDPCPPSPPLDVGCDGAEVDTEDEYESEELHAFNCFLAGLSELGYGFAYRVLDAQFVRVDGLERAVPQRRRRVFVVGHLGDWRAAAAVLFEPEGMRGDSPPRREARQGVAGAVVEGVALRGRDGGGTAELSGPISTAVRASQGGGDKPHALIAFDCKAGANTGFAIGAVPGALRGDGHGGGHAAIAFAENSRAEVRLCGGDGAVAAQLTTGGGKPGQGFPAVAVRTSHTGANGIGVSEGVAHAVERAPEAVATGYAVRRLTPREAERLQGFEDDWTLIPYRGKPASDGPRYRAIGNSMAVNVMHWIGGRIDRASALTARAA